MILLCCCIITDAQQSLWGVVKDKSTGKPMYNVTVYIPELLLGTVTEEDGAYQFSGMASGTFTITFSYVGYARVIKTVSLEGGKDTLNIYMEDNEIETEEVVVFGTKNNDPDRTPINISTISQQEARAKGSYSISDALSKLPGMSQLSTGVGISKPVIRGLYGNRIQTQLLGIRFDNQQWQDEHGLGLNDVGIDRIEIIKGPASIMYGSEAIGGVLNVIEEKPAEVNTKQGDVNARFFSNTLGGSLDVGFKGSNEKLNWRIRAGAESNADYSDGNEKRVFNSRFDGYMAKGTLSFKKKNWYSANNYMFSLNRFGFILDTSLNHVDTTVSRWSRDFTGPHHQVLFNILTTQNTIYRGRTKIKINAGAHVNHRQEQEGGNKISLDMLLYTVDADAQFVRNVNEKTEFTIGLQPMFQTNHNSGKKVIVPDANLFENGIFAYLKESWSKVILETGLRLDVKNIKAFKTTNYDFADSGLINQNHYFIVPNGSLGIAFKPNENFTGKLNFSSGYRAPNLAELYSNGLHEGTFRWEEGDADMKSENNINVELAATYETKILSANISVYRNQIFNYIYLNPTGEQFVGFDIYRYVQKDAYMQGGEISIDISPQTAPLDFYASYSIIRGKTSDDENLPFIPSDKIEGEIRVNLFKAKHPDETFIKAGVEYNFTQDHVGQFETPSPAYTLVNAGAGTILHFQKQNIKCSLVCNNLLNEAYYDALSRFKNYNLLNIGRNVNLNIRIPF
ncbi:MAG TPA: TonB-dependent receptor [Chitinophagales bacterium]|nr:TonB-dependent receptor [Chitinophagales bacterium]